MRLWWPGTWIAQLKPATCTPASATVHPNQSNTAVDLESASPRRERIVASRIICWASRQCQWMFGLDAKNRKNSLDGLSHHIDRCWAQPKRTLTRMWHRPARILSIYRLNYRLAMILLFARWCRSRRSGGLHISLAMLKRVNWSAILDLWFVTGAASDELRNIVPAIANWRMKKFIRDFLFLLKQSVTRTEVFPKMIIANNIHNTVNCSVWKWFCEKKKNTIYCRYLNANPVNGEREWQQTS